jgi:hypothetical protein
MWLARNDVHWVDQLHILISSIATASIHTATYADRFCELNDTIGIFFELFET